MIYLDNAATSFPKPKEVIVKVNEAFTLFGANPGRSGHDMSIAAAGEVYKTRETLNRFFNGYGSEFVSFYTNCTYALNSAINGIVKNGDHIIISSLEHNSVARPVNALQKSGTAEFSVFGIDENEDELLENFEKSFKKNTKLCVVTAVSNVFGNILPLKKLSEITHRHGALFFVDGAQGAGVVKIDMKEQGIDCLCVPGHKGLLGPMGTGALLHRGLDFTPTVTGGTGTLSFELTQPQEYPERLESGTLNVPGICGLRKGIETVEKYGLGNIFEKECRLCEELFEGLKGIDGILLYRDDCDRKKYAPVISFNIDGMHSEEVAAIFNENGFAVRGGYHCSALAHITYGTERTGAVRVSPSFNTPEKGIKNLLILIRKIAFRKTV